MGNKQSSPNYGTRMASTHDISDLDLDLDVASKKKEFPLHLPASCLGTGWSGAFGVEKTYFYFARDPHGCWVCDWD